MVGAVGAKDWTGGFLDLKADFQDATFVGNEPLIPEAKSGYLGETSGFCWLLEGEREKLSLALEIVVMMNKQLTRAKLVCKYSSTWVFILLFLFCIFSCLDVMGSC